MNIFKSMAGMEEVELTSADPGKSLMLAAQAGIHIFETRPISDLTVIFRIRRGDLRKLNSILRKRGDSLRFIRHTGVYWTWKRLMKRPVLLLGFLIMTLLALFLPGRICFIKVEGNVSVPSRQILEAAEDCGIRFGASRREVRSELMKNRLLAAIPELQWAGVNTKGCVAVISIREKTEGNKEELHPAVSSIVAVRDGIIVRCTAEQGMLMCRVGQAVTKGDILINGYTDCGLCVRASRAIGEVYAQTRLKLRAITPGEYTVRGPETGLKKKYALIIGKKRINFYKDSGILGTTCDKMSTVNYITLPGEFVLPVALVTEVWRSYECRTEFADEARAERILYSFARTYLNRQMVAGRILQKEELISVTDSSYQLTGSYACLEMIGRERSEETLEHYGKTD